MKQFISKIVGHMLNKRPKPVYGMRIFYHKSWLDKQVDEAMRKRAYDLD